MINVNEVDKSANNPDNIIKEYEELRNEIKQKVELHNSLITFMITTVIAILAFAVEGDSTILYLLPFGIIIPISMRVTYYRTAMLKLSAYIIVFLESEIEELNWETRNSQLVNNDRSIFYDKVTISHYYEGMILSIICYVLYCFAYSKDKTINLQAVICLVIPLIFVIWEAMITKRIAYFNKERNEWIEKWTDVNVE